MHNLGDNIFYMKTNVLQDFHICMSVPLSFSSRGGFRIQSNVYDGVLTTFSS